MRRPLVGVLCLAALAILALPSTLEAATIHRHLTVHRQSRIPDTGESVTVARHVVRVVEVPSMPPAPAVAPQSSVSIAPPTPTATSVAPASAGSCGGITPYPGAGQCWAIPYNIVACESGGQDIPNAEGSGASGYYQLMDGGTGDKASQDAAAAALYASSGTAPWVSSENCWG